MRSIIGREMNFANLSLDFVRWKLWFPDNVRFWGNEGHFDQLLLEPGRVKRSALTYRQQGVKIHKVLCERVVDGIQLSNCDL
jgi:hypothetical protein